MAVSFITGGNKCPQRNPCDQTSTPSSRVGMTLINNLMVIAQIACKSNFNTSMIHDGHHIYIYIQESKTKKESFWIRELRTLHPEGINKKA